MLLSLKTLPSVECFKASDNLIFLLNSWSVRNLAKTGSYHYPCASDPFVEQLMETVSTRKHHVSADRDENGKHVLHA
jgi:hypothetical protein